MNTAFGVLDACIFCKAVSLIYLLLPPMPTTTETIAASAITSTEPSQQLRIFNVIRPQVHALTHTQRPASHTPSFSAHPNGFQECEYQIVFCSFRIYFGLCLYFTSRRECKVGLDQKKCPSKIARTDHTRRTLPLIQCRGQ